MRRYRKLWNIGISSSAVILRLQNSCQAHHFTLTIFLTISSHFLGKQYGHPLSAPPCIFSMTFSFLRAVRRRLTNRTLTIGNPFSPPHLQNAAFVASRRHWGACLHRTPEHLRTSRLCRAERSYLEFPAMLWVLRALPRATVQKRRWSTRAAHSRNMGTADLVRLDQRCPLLNSRRVTAAGWNTITARYAALELA